MYRINNIKLKDNEKLLKVNAETGELNEIKKRVTSGDTHSSNPFILNDSPFQRCYTRAWMLLQTQTSDKEFLVSWKLALMAEAFTNSLRPLRPESTILELSETLGVNRRNVGDIIDKLFKLGVIGKFEVYDRNEDYQNYWIFNPYLQFNGKVIKKDVPTLFDNTFYAHV